MWSENGSGGSGRKADNGRNAAMSAGGAMGQELLSWYSEGADNCKGQVDTKTHLDSMTRPFTEPDSVTLSIIECEIVLDPDTNKPTLSGSG